MGMSGITNPHVANLNLMFPFHVISLPFIAML